MMPAYAAPKKKKNEKYDYITVTVLEQFSMDMAYRTMKRGMKPSAQEETTKPMINFSFDGDELAKELEMQFYKQHEEHMTMALALDFLGEEGWEVSTTTQLMLDSGLLMTTVVLQKAKK
jgi:hypothetical protein